MLLPCKACGASCNALCNGCSHCLCPENKPSPLFVIFSTVMNLLCLLFAVLGLLAKKEHSDVIDYGPPTMWLGVCIGIAIGNMIFACYLYWRFAHMTEPSAENGGRKVSPMKAACQLFLYDIGVLIYLGFCVFMIVWCVLDKKCDYPNVPGARDSGYCDDQENAIVRCKLILGLYMGLGLVVMFLSVCTECCRPPRYVTNQQVAYQAYQAPAPVPYNHQAPAYQQPPPQQAAYPAAPPPPHNQAYAPPYEQQNNYAQPQYGQPEYAQPQYGQPEYAQYQQHPPQQQQQQNGTMASKAGNAVGGLLGKLTKK
eukprot:TRINITY_DN23774_c0_g1_i1.p1 TRINITY_DN23774_c0_g1~~TRINITY_DN23774_c0_g1_i1.p1  ORF type:complete len:311 (+),score=64.44 TRINITY_DN23774_c0_g1_i1:37-969(+)